MTIAYDVNQPYSNGRVIGSRRVRVDRQVQRRKDESLKHCLLRGIRDIQHDGGNPINVVLTQDEELSWLLSEDSDRMIVSPLRGICGLPYTVELSE